MLFLSFIVLHSCSLLFVISAESSERDSILPPQIGTPTLVSRVSNAESSKLPSKAANSTLSTQQKLTTDRASALTTKSVIPLITAENSARTSSEQCYSSWYSELYSRNDPQLWLTTQNVSRNTDILVYETIRSFGQGIAYTGCDNIPRFRFTAKPTSSTTSSVTVTITREVIEMLKTPNMQGVGWEDSQKNTSDYWMHPKWKDPNCSLDQRSCRRLWAAYNGEIGAKPQNASWDIYLPPWHGDCPMFRFCDLDLKEVILIYWPDDTQPRNACAAETGTVTKSITSQTPAVVTFKTNAITFRGQDLYLRKLNNKDWNHLGRDQGRQLDRLFEEILADGEHITEKPYLNPSVMTGDWTFTSPTVYMAHRDITANVLFHEWDLQPEWKGNRTFTTLRKAGVIPVRKQDIFSMRPLYPSSQKLDAARYAQLVASGSYNPIVSFYTPANGEGWVDYGQKNYEAVPVDFRHLEDPVPAKEYFDARYDDCWGKQSHCATITDDSYRPRLSIVKSFWTSLLPEDFYCVDPLVVDPPITLRPVRPDEYLDPYPSLPGTAVPALQTPVSTAEAGRHSKADFNQPRPGVLTRFEPPEQTKTPGTRIPLLNSRPGQRGGANAWNRGGNEGNHQGGSPGSSGDSRGSSDGSPGSSGGLWKGNTDDTSKDKTGGGLKDRPNTGTMPQVLHNGASNVVSHMLWKCWLSLFLLLYPQHFL